MKKSLLTLIASVIFGYSGFSQNQTFDQKVEDSTTINHFALGLKLGIPNLAAGTAEIILPILNYHFAPYAEYSKLAFNFTALETTTTYTEVGVNYYFKNQGNGFFISLGKGMLNTDLLFKNLLFSNSNTRLEGSALTVLNLNTTNIKLGIKTAGTLYFRFEIGYGIGTIPDQLVFFASSNGITNLFNEALPPLPGLGSNGLLIGAVGFGISF